MSVPFPTMSASSDAPPPRKLSLDSGLASPVLGLSSSSPPLLSPPISPVFYPGISGQSYFPSPPQFVMPISSLGSSPESAFGSPTGSNFGALPGQFFGPGKNLRSDDVNCGDSVRACVERPGYISLKLHFDIDVDIAINQAIRVINRRAKSAMTVTACAMQMAVDHPMGRMMQYNSRIETQIADDRGFKNAKMWPRGVSFTSSDSALVYLVDEAGTRSTTDQFHDLFASNIVDEMFLKSCGAYSHTSYPLGVCINRLDQIEYWRNESNVDCWIVNDVSVKQMPDGFVIVERKVSKDMFVMKTSPTNGKARLENSFVYFTASLGEEAHLFVRSMDRRLHYNKDSFVVRNAGHAAGYDEHGQVKMF